MGKTERQFVLSDRDARDAIADFVLRRHKVKVYDWYFSWRGSADDVRMSEEQ